MAEAEWDVIEVAPDDAPPPPKINRPLRQILREMADCDFVFVVAPRNPKTVRDSCSVIGEETGSRFLAKAMQFQGKDGIGIWRLPRAQPAKPAEFTGIPMASKKRLMAGR